MGRAHFNLCNECNKHGRITLADGFVCLEICFQRHGLRLVDLGRDQGIYSKEEARSLRKAIKESGLPYDWDSIPLAYHWCLEFLNEKRASGLPVPIEIVHSFLQQQVDFNNIPPNLRSVLERDYPL